MTDTQYYKISDSLEAADLNRGTHIHAQILASNIIKLAEFVDSIRESIEGSEKVRVPEDKDAMVSEVIKAMTEAGLTQEVDIFRKNILA